MANFDLEKWKIQLREFARERDWEKFHTPKNLVMALAVEASELMELFQWLEKEEIEKKGDELKEMAADEMADVLVYLIRLSTVLNIDLQAALTQKMKKNDEKYPAQLVKGSAKKYNEYK